MSTDFENREETIETAAEREAHYWRGKALHPFSFSRQAAAERVSAKGASSLESATLLVYLCTLEPKEIDPVRGSVEIAAFRARMSEWADAEGISIATAEDIGKVADAIWEEMEASRFSIQKKPDDKTDPSPKNA